MTTALEIRHSLLELMSSDTPSGLIRCAYLFGSFARNRERAESDIDLAFLLDRETYKKDPFEGTAPVHMIAGKMGLELDRVVDVTILNSASLEMAYEVVSEGECLFEIDPEERLQYELKVKGMYFDFRPFINELRRERLGLPLDYEFR
jgi:predicted nucleotidyltransferase